MLKKISFEDEEFGDSQREQQVLQQNESAGIAIQKQVVYELPTVQHLMNLLEINPGIILIKFGADWCKPCKKIKPLVDGFFASSPPNVICADLNVDENNSMLYSYLKKNRMVNGIPVLLMYKLGNKSIIPTDSVTGADLNDLHRFFQRCGNHMRSLQMAFRSTSS